ncbi:MAG: phosphatase PAP2 family protein [Calditrichaeota bacterium]|nr:phosphatase PAP2 family protein [Calditrichota bacterium]
MAEIIGFINSLDARALYFINNFGRNPVFDWLMPWFDSNRNWMAPLILLWIGVMIWGGRRGRWASAAAVILVVLSDQISSSLIKPLVERIRPCNVLSGLHFWQRGEWLIIPDPILTIYKKSFSFPSSHATNSAAQALWWSWIYPRSAAAWIVLVVVIGYSRLYIGVHYPADVLGGWLAGGICFGMIYGVVKKWGPQDLKY